jgi:hypothetical protein
VRADAPKEARDQPLERWNGLTPILMSLTVLVIILCDLRRHGLHAPHRDESTADHLAIILMYGQLPVMASFAICGWQKFKGRIAVLAVQIALWALTCACAYLS